MMGWIALAATGAIAAVLLWRLDMPRTLALIAGAALMLGATGYALQGRPAQPGSPVQAAARGLTIEPGFREFRSAILGTRHRGAFSLADAAIEAGRPQDAVSVMLRTVDRAPDDPAAWTALGNAYAVNDVQQLSPAARFAFARAVRLAPRDPGPPFFLGLALVNVGDLEGAEAAWRRALALTPADAPYRADIAERVLLIRGFVRMRAGTAASHSAAGAPPVSETPPAPADR